MRILVVAAHPDDEVLGCGGLLARRIREGHTAAVMILGEGVTSRFGRREDAPTQEIANIQVLIRQAADILGVSEVRSESLPDNRFDTVPLLDIVKRIEAAIEDFRPDTVYTQHGGDLNIDHVVTFRAVMTAVRPMAGRSVRALYSFETPSATEWAFSQFQPVFQPDTFVDIHGFLETKIAALDVYESETRVFPHPRSPEAMRAMARKWGATVGLHEAEAFRTVFHVS